MHNERWGKKRIQNLETQKQFRNHLFKYKGDQDVKAGGLSQRYQKIFTEIKYSRSIVQLTLKLAFDGPRAEDVKHFGVNTIHKHQLVVFPKMF